MSRVRLSIDFTPLEKYVDTLTKRGKSGYNQIFIRWIVRYKKFAKARFNANSKGGGLWPPLKKDTRKRVRKRSRLILRDSDKISQTLEPIPTLNRNPSPGIQTIPTRNGIIITFGNTGKHPYSKLSIGKLAKTHSLGLGRVPERVILVNPSEMIKRRMVNDVREIARLEKKKLGMK